MSAFICSDNHINTIVSRCRNKSDTRLQEVATILLNENVRSVNYRYRESNKHTITYIPTGAEMPVVGVLKLCYSYEYQSCETDDWKTTRAYSILQKIIVVLIEDLPGYEESDWAI